MQISLIGRSVSGQSLKAFEFRPKVLRQSSRTSTTFIFAGKHGNEVEGVIACEALLGALLENNPFSFPILLVPNLNPDGVYQLTRTNLNGVDLNRNFPTKDWSPVATDPKYPPGAQAASEPETRAIIQYLETHRPAHIISLHSFSNFMLNTNGDCVDLALAISKINSYKVEPSIGYPTPGSFGTYAVEQGLSCLTYELERGMEFKQIVDHHLPALWAGLDFIEKKMES